MLKSHKLPTNKTSGSFVEFSGASEDALDAVGTSQGNLNVSSSGVLDPDLNSDMFQCLEVVPDHLRRSDLHRALHPCFCNRFSTLHGTIYHLGTLSFYCGHEDPRLRFDNLPVSSHFNVTISIETTEAIFVRVFAPCSGGIPIWVFWVDGDCRSDAKVLDVTPGQIRTVFQRQYRILLQFLVDLPNFEGQGEDTDSQGCCGTGASVGWRARILSDVGGDLDNRPSVVIW